MGKSNKKMIDFAEYEKIISVNISKLTPHPKNEKLLPRLTKGELNRLKDRIKKYGFVEPIEITKSGTVLDGNNRIFKILIPDKTELEEAGVKVDKIPVRIIDIPESDEENYIISKNFDRRQLSKLMQSYIRGQQHNEMKKEIGYNQYTIIKKYGGEKTSPPKKTAVILADRFGITDRTIKNDGRFTKICDELIALTDYNFVFNLLNGEIKANKSLITQLSKQPNDFVGAVFSHYSNDYSDKHEYKPLKEVIESINGGKHNKEKKPLTKRISFDIKVELENKIEALSREKGIDIENLIETIIEKGLEVF